MADKEGSSVRKRKRSKQLNYFYLNGDLHKSLHINRGQDTIMAWSYPLHKRVGYVYSDVKKNHGKAWTTTEVSQLLDRSKLTIARALDGHVNPPQHTYGLSTGKFYQYLWDEDSIMDLHAYLMTVHRGRPRKDGKITVNNLPNARELRAMLRQQMISYVKLDDGTFVPSFKA